MSIYIPTDSYYAHDFWNALKKNTPKDLLPYNATAPHCGAFFVPLAGNTKYKEALEKENFFRRLGTVIPTKEWDTKVTIANATTEPAWVPDGGDIPEAAPIESVVHFYCHKLASLTRIHNSVLTDTDFDFEDWMLNGFART